MNYVEEGVVFTRGQDRLVGIAALPEHPAPVAVLFLVGGPQYRAGSHRQFTLLARALATQGIASFRFDYAGMGDSEGERASFDATGADIESALVALKVKAPATSGVVLWGLCDAASAAMIHAHSLPDVAGLVLANPWVHGGEYSPRFRLSHYYRPLLKEAGAWKRLLSGKVDLRPALRDTFSALTRSASPDDGNQSRHFVEAMLAGMDQFRGTSLVLLSENDLTAREFQALSASDSRWQSVLEEDRVSIARIAEADHTFSRSGWRELVTRHTLAFVSGLCD